MSDKQYSLRELIHPTPRQEDFLRATDSTKYVLYGGAKGGGKSYILRWALIRKLLKWAYEGHRGVRVGLFCENYPALKDRQISKINSEFPRWLGTLADSQVGGMSFKLAPQFGGGVLALRNLDDPSKYASSEFAIAAVDELTKNPREVFDQLRSIIRWPGIENTGFWGGTNPGEIGHLWVKKLWLDRQFGPEDPSGELFKFIPSLPTDNPHNAQSYLEELRKLPERLRKAYWDGNWDVFEGQYFTEWDRQKHVISPFEVPKPYKRFRAYDHGRANAACCKWYALDYDGRVFVYRELYVKGLNVDQISTEINRLSEGETYEYSIADPAIFANIGFVDKFGGQTIAESFARNGIMFIPASNRRIDGWNLMHQYLYWDEQTLPKIRYFSICVDSIRTIPALIHDDHKVEDVDTDGEDHCFTGDTLVDTVWGKEKIRDLVGKSIYVRTLKGFEMCRNVRQTRRSKVWQLVLSDGRKIRATPDHRFFTNNGWKELRCLDSRYDRLIQLDTCIGSYLRLSRNLMANAIRNIVRFVIGSMRRLSSLLPVRDSAISIVKCEPCGVEEVYDLTVPSTEHFTVAGGIMVHNCADVDRYFLMSLHERKSLQPKTDVEKKLDQVRQKTLVSPGGFNDFYYG